MLQPRWTFLHITAFSKLSAFVRKKSKLHHYYIQNVKDRVEVRVYTISKERVELTNFSQYISVKVEKILRKSQAQIKEKLRKLRL